MSVVDIGKQVVTSLASGQIPEQELIALFISKLLGAAIVAGACIVKLPQIFTVWKSKSGKGLPLISSELENYVYLIHVSYGIIMGLPLLAFGEAAASWVQNLMLLALLYRFKSSSPLRAMLSILVVIAVATPVYMGLISQALIMKLYDANSTIFLVSKLPQIYAAFKEGKTGQASIFTNGLQFLGGVARVFTSIKEGAGMPMVRGFILGSFVNGLITGQILYYGEHGRTGAPQVAAEEQEEKKKER